MLLFDEIKADYRRHGSSASNPAFWALATYRFGRWAAELPRPARAVGGKLYGAMALAVELTSGITLHREVEIGAAFHLVHSGNIKIHPATRIGDRVGIMHDVTLGSAMDRPGAPTLGDDVFVGAGAKVLGCVTIGNRARIAANSLVVTDVPADATAIGVPAKILRYTGRPQPIVAPRDGEVAEPPPSSPPAAGPTRPQLVSRH